MKEAFKRQIKLAFDSLKVSPQMKMYLYDWKLLFSVYWIDAALSVSMLSNNPLLSINDTPVKDVADFVIAKGYIPKEKDLPKSPLLKNTDNDVTYLLSKLSDDELIKLLSEQPNKSEYNLKDLIKTGSGATKHTEKHNAILDLEQNSKSNAFSNVNDLFDNMKKKRFQTVSQKNQAYFRLDNKEVEPFATPKGTETNNGAVQKLNNLLYSRPSETESEFRTDMDDVKKELLFDILVGQLKVLCCKKNIRSKGDDKAMLKLQSFLNDLMPQEKTSKIENTDLKNTHVMTPNEYMFLILNDEIKSSGNEESDLISVDPDSLGKNSSVMLLGPITTSLSDTQLKLVMERISNEIVKEEYLPLLQKISDGTLGNDSTGLADKFLRGSLTRRYIKPHRCNHQSALARVYGGPKWLICSGYINLNKPSLYD